MFVGVVSMVRQCLRRRTIAFQSDQQHDIILTHNIILSNSSSISHNTVTDANTSDTSSTHTRHVHAPTRLLLLWQVRQGK